LPVPYAKRANVLPIAYNAGKKKVVFSGATPTKLHLQTCNVSYLMLL